MKRSSSKTFEFVFAFMFAFGFLLVAHLLEGSSLTWAEPPAPAEKKPKESAVLPQNASEGARDLAKLSPPLADFVRRQAYGATWKDVIKIDPPPKDRSGLGKAQTHSDLEHDPIEMQDQVQFLAESGLEVRFGFVSLRGVRVFRHGRLAGAQLVLERIGRDPQNLSQYKADLGTVAGHLGDLSAALGLSDRYLVTRNDLELLAKDPEKAFNTPLRIELEPTAEKGKR